MTETSLTLELARTGKYQRRNGVLVDAGDTVPQELYSQPYEKIDIAPIPRRKRASTIPRALLAQKRQLRNSAPYEAIEIIESAATSMVASGSFEAAWFALPDEEVTEPEALATANVDGAKWMMISGAVLGALAVVIGLLTI